MVNFLDTQSDAQRLAALLAEYDRRLQALERTTQAAHTSIEGGSMDIYDTDGTLKGSVGVQPDGGVALVPVNTDPPPTPTPPTIEPVLAGLLVGWDGLWDDSYATPSDFSLVQVHVGPSAEFTPDLSTLAAMITNVAGGTITVATAEYASVWVRLVAVNAAQVTGPPSTAVQGTPRQVDGPDLSQLIDLAVWLKDESVPGSKLVRETIGADLLAANSVVAGKIAADSITGREVKAQSLEGLHIKAGTLDATHIKAGSIVAELISADALNGKVITGSTVQTGTAGARIVLDKAMRLYDANGQLAAEAKLADSTTDVGFAAYNTSGLGRYYSLLSRGYVRFGKEGISYAGLPGIDHLVAGGAISNVRLFSGSVGTTSGVMSAMWLIGAPPDGSSLPRVEIASNAMDSRCDLLVSGMVTSRNIITGTVHITPAAANVPQAVSITGLNVAGSTHRGFVGPHSSVPGTGFVACTSTDVTSQGMTIWLTRSDTKVRTTVDWMIIGS